MHLSFVFLSPRVNITSKIHLALNFGTKYLLLSSLLIFFRSRSVFESLSLFLF